MISLRCMLLLHRNSVRGDAHANLLCAERSLKFATEVRGRPFILVLATLNKLCIPGALKTPGISKKMAFSLNPIALANKIVQMGDPRTRDYPLVVNPLFVFPLVCFYLYFVKVAGPRWMKGRKPFEIINLMRGYNLFMVAISALFLYLHLKMTYLPGGRYNLWCQGMTGDIDEELAYYYKHGWFFIAVRYADLLDTVFCVLRKKFNQITHLHVIHHTMVTVNVWFYALFAPEGQPALGLAINAFVHMVMYFYYYLATLGPGVRKHLWWKKYLTALQIVQFIVVIAHISIPLFVDCGFPKPIILLGGLQTFVLLCLFVNFYIKAYMKQDTFTKASLVEQDVDIQEQKAAQNVKED